MKRNVFVSVAAVAALTFGAFPARHVAADTDNEQSNTEIVAPLDKADCSAQPPTITVLGLTIDVSSADFGGASCDTLVVGQVVEVTLAGTTPPLAATEVRQEGSSEDSQNSSGQDANGGNETGTSNDSQNGDGQDN